jgi:hypothetical protein
MKKYIIEIKMRINNKIETVYFENITECKNNQVMNVFEEHVTHDKAKAKRFYDEGEAERFRVLFDYKPFRTSKVLTVKK